MAIEIHRAGVRKALEIRREPYWAMLSKGRFIGFRKISAECGSWIARMRDADGKQRYEAVGAITDAFNYDKAVKAAQAWFKNRDKGISDEPVTVRQACEAYVEDRRREKSSACALDAEQRFKRYVYDAPIGAMQLSRIRTSDLKAWRHGLGLGKASQNRHAIVLKAALNLAIEDKKADPSVKAEWRAKAFKPHKKADGRRELFLDLAQRKALLDAAEGSIRDLIEAALLTGARPGELVSLTRSAFDHKTGILKLTGKTGPRYVALPPAALALFTRLSKSKLPPAYLLTREDGKSWMTVRWDLLVAAAAQKAGLPSETCLYTCRHSFIAQCIMNGMNVFDVAKFTGTSLAMVEANYGKFLPNAAREKLALVQMV